MRDFRCLYRHDFLRIASCVPRGAVADPNFAVAETLEMAVQGHEAGTALMLFPELGLSAYAIDDLLFQAPLLDAVEGALATLVAASQDLSPVLVVGAPLRHQSRLYNTAVVIHAGTILGVVPKSYLPNYREFYERRHFTPGLDEHGGYIALLGADVPFGVDLLFRS